MDGEKKGHGRREKGLWTESKRDMYGANERAGKKGVREGVCVCVCVCVSGVGEVGSGDESEGRREQGERASQRASKRTKTKQRTQINSPIFSTAP